jgi:hypothetical protein
MRYITIGLALLLFGCVGKQEPQKRVTIPERPPEAAKVEKPCPPGLPKLCCKDMKACQ